MRSLLLPALAVLLSAASIAHADTINNFQFQSDLNGGYLAQGTITIDTTTGVVETSNFTLSQNGTVDATFTNPDYDGTFGSASFIAEFPNAAAGYTYELILPTASLVGYLGSSVCTQTATCDYGYPSGVLFSGGGGEAAYDGSLSPTPEPSSLLLLATGVLAGTAVLRKRFAAQ